MDNATLASIVVAACGALILGMAAMLKALVVKKLDDIQESLVGLSDDVHAMDIRVTRLETEHNLHACRFHEGA